ncbi:MAG: LCP family protein [Clostridia bacterium]|nr:LCP family protein [Clostridia bacterium]
MTTPPENKSDNSIDKGSNKKRILKKIFLIILAVILTMLMCAASVIAYTYFFHEPETGVNEPPPFATGGLTETLSPETTAETLGDETAVETTPPETVAETTPDQLPKSQQKIYNFLFVGQDRVALNTDVIMLINFNTTTNKINILQLPRDTYIRTNIYSGKLNGLYAQFYITNGGKVTEALRSMANVLEQNLCIKIHNVGHINLNGVISIVDSIGGVDVNVPVAYTYFDEIAQQNITVHAGIQHLDGLKAEHFIRMRSQYIQADIGRIDAQKIFVSAFIKKLKSNFNVTTIANFVDVAFKNIKTDLSLADAVFYGKQLLEVDLEQINMMSMVGRGASGDGISFYVMVRKNMCEMINTYFNIYDFDITDSIFDPNRVFTNTAKFSHFNNIYTDQSITTTDPHNADDINNDSIYIPHV